MRTLIVPVAVAVSVWACFAQAPSPPQSATQAEMTTHDAPLKFNSDVFLVQVPVIVRDAKGSPVGTLQKDDFQLFDRGKKQTITRFVVQRPGKSTIQAVNGVDAAAPGSTAPEAVIAERYIAYVFDDVHLDPGDLLRTRLAALDHVDQAMDAITRVAVFTTSSLGELDFTDDRNKVHDALNRIQPTVRTPSANDDCPPMTYYLADLIRNKQDAGALALSEVDAQACSPDPSASTQPVTSFERDVMLTALRTLTVGETETNRVLNVLKVTEQRMTVLPGSRSIVMISPGFLVPGDDLQPVEQDLLERAIKNNVVINTLDALAVTPINSAGPASSRPSRTLNQTAMTNYEIQSRLSQQDILMELAYGTGGAFFHNDNGMKEGLDQLVHQPEFVYMLGFSPEDLKFDGNYHSLKVTVRTPAGLNLQARRGYYSPKHSTDPAEAAKEQIREAVFSRDEIRDIPVDLRLQFFKSTSVNAKLTVISKVDTRNIRFHKDQDRSRNTLTLVAGLFDRNGIFVNGIQRVVEMNLRPQSLATLDTAGITLKTDFDVTPGNYTVRVVVRDSEGQTMAARNGAVLIP
jgi:VWFA-related protein